MQSTTPNNPDREITKPMTANQELEDCLTKAVNAFNVREMLTKFGISEDAEATIEIQMGDNSEPLARCEIPTTIKKEHIPRGIMSLDSFHNLVIDDFINPALNVLDMGEYLPDDDGKFARGESGMKMVFRSNSPNYRMNLATYSFCCKPCGNNNCCRVCSALNRRR